jgi:predicted transcriptional regulator
MQTQKLIAAGLTEQQAAAYALLIEASELAPPQAAAKLRLTRSNAYKVLDKLVELGLASKQEKHKKFTYVPTNPTALSRLAAEQRNIATAQENAAQEVISELLRKYREHTDQPDIGVVTGRQSVADAYRLQAKQKAPIYFLRSTADISTMGFDTMHAIRTEPERQGLTRHGITPDKSTTAGKDSKLKRTWLRSEDYTAPVEWSVAGENLLIVVFGEEPHAVTIESPLIAEAFRQIWRLMDSCLRAMTYYQDLPRRNR